MSEEKQETKIEEAVSFWDSDDVKSIEKEGGGSGWITYAEITYGYKVFASGKTNEETFWRFDVKNEKSRDVARQQASDFARSVNAKPPVTSMAVIAPKNNTYLRDTSTWKGDAWWVLPTYTKAYDVILKPSLRGADAVLGKQWVRLGFKPDPYKPTRKSTNQLTGEEQEVANLVPYVIEKFDSIESAMAAIEGGMAEKIAQPQTSSAPAIVEQQETGDFPKGWDADSWNFAIKDIKAQSAAGKAPAEIAKAYEIGIAYVMKALSA